MFRQRPSAPRTSASESGSWPTPTVDDSSNVTRESGDYQSLTRAVMYPTPGANEDSYRLGGDTQQSNSLGAMARREAISEGSPSGQLNPTWVEWLMGFPLGWTDCEHLATRSFRRSLK